MLIKYKDIEFDIPIEGWDEEVASPRKRSKALTLQAICNLELKSAVGGGLPPRQRDILHEVRRLQAELGVKVLSEKSEYQIEKNIKKLLAEKHIFYKEEVPPKSRGRGRGGKTSPWASRYVYPLIYEQMKKQKQ